MKPEDYIDENYIPTEEDFAPEQVNEKEQLRKSIKKSCRTNTVLYSIAAFFFLINGIFHLDQVNDSKLYLCPLIAVMLISTFAMITYAIVYERIRRSSTAKEMQQHLNLLNADTSFSKMIITTLALCLTIATVLGLIDKCPWYVVVLAALAVAGSIAGLCWLLKYTGKADPNDLGIERLRALEEQDNQSL